MSTTPNDPDRPTRRQAVGLVGTSYVFESMLFHLAKSGSSDLLRPLLARLESDDFLVRQAERPDGFELGAQQLERYVLPATIRLGDWERFFRYLLTAANLRDLAQTLDDPAILRALARSGRLELARALVGRLPEAADRVRGWALLASVPSPADPAFEKLASALRVELDGMPVALDSADEETERRWADALSTAGRLLAPRLRARWAGWIAALTSREDLADRVRSAVAEGFFDAGQADAPELWELLAEVRVPEVLIRLLPDRLADAAGADPDGGPRRWLGAVRGRLPQAVGAPRLGWSVGLALLARCGTDGSSERAAALWRWLRSELGGAEAAPWDGDLLERGAALWPRLSDAELRQLASDLGSTVLAAHLRVLVAEGRGDRESYRVTLARLSEVPDAREQLSLYLRTLGTVRGETEVPARELRSRMKALLAHLAEVQYAVPSEDLCRALDLVARHLPRQLRRTVDAALAAPESDADTLRSFARLGAERALLEELLARAETYAALAAGDAAEGFELRGEVLTLLACRLLRCGADPELLTEVAERLLPEEEDRLRAEAARALGPDQRAAEALCSGIRDRRLRLRTRLETLPEGADRSQEGDLVAPESLYEAAVRLDAVEDELRVLRGLLRQPDRPAELASRHFGGLHGAGRRVEALADLARHALRYQQRRLRPGRQDRLAAVLPLKESLGVVESDRWLLSLTPELVAIGGHLGAREAVAEVQEAFERVVELESVPWDVRERVLIEILGSIVALFPGGGPALGQEPAGEVEAPLGHLSAKQRLGRAAELVTWLAGFPERAEGRHGVARLRQRWHRMLPVLTAVGERLSLSRPGVSTALRESARRGREWAPEHRTVFDLCRASMDERRGWAERLIEGEGGSVAPETARALAWLLAGGSRGADGLISAFVQRVDPGADRGRTVLELLRAGPIAEGEGAALVRLLSDGTGEARSWGTVWLGVRHPEAVAEADWLAAVAELASRDRLDPGDPANLPVRRRLWTVRSERAPGEIGRAALRALSMGGGEAGQRAARLFLSTLVQPKLGESGSGAARRRYGQVCRALVGARTLKTKASTPGRPDDSGGSVPDEGGDEGTRGAGEGSEVPGGARGILERLRRWGRIWARRPLRPDEAPNHEALSRSGGDLPGRPILRSRPAFRPGRPGRPVRAPSRGRSPRSGCPG